MCNKNGSLEDILLLLPDIHPFSDYYTFFIILLLEEERHASVLLFSYPSYVTNKRQTPQHTLQFLGDPLEAPKGVKPH